MRGERLKQATQEIEKHAHYAHVADACREALREDTPEAYKRAMEHVANHSGGGEYAVNVDRARSALREDR